MRLTQGFQHSLQILKTARERSGSEQGSVQQLSTCIPFTDNSRKIKMCSSPKMPELPPPPPPAPPAPAKSAKIVNRPKDQAAAQAQAARRGTSLYRIPQLNY